MRCLFFILALLAVSAEAQGRASRKAFKRDIFYIDNEAKQELTEEVLAVKLATYNYKEETEGTKKHLGFIIEDIGEDSAAVDASGDAVELYGYLSMAVAAIQSQEKEISALKEELKNLKESVLAAAGKASVV